MTRWVLVVIGVAALGCASSSTPSSAEPKYSYCVCEMWGVSGVDPGPDYVRPARPPECARIMKRPPEQDCPIPN